jgi:RNA polymerase sigma-70 factor (ECF subfamily)
MSDEPLDVQRLVRRMADGDQKALAEAFAHYRGRLRRMVQLRLDRRLQGRLDASDVLQDAYLDLANRAAEYAANPALPLFLWMRLLTGQRLLILHRKHLRAKMRDAAQEVSLYRGALPQASSVSLAAQLLGRLSSPSHAAIRAENRRRWTSARSASAY